MEATNHPYLYTPEQYAAEREVAALLHRLSKVKHDPVPGWQAYQEGLDRSQLSAVERMMYEPLTLLYGPPGSGKTTITRRAVQTFDNSGMKILAVAPTGKASRGLNEVIYGVHDSLNAMPDCKTTYRALEFNPQTGGFVHNNRKPLDYDVIFADEWGFVGTRHARDFLLAIDPKRTRFIAVGDPYQLPSVEAGSIYRDMINSRRFANAELNEIHRQGANSGIAYNATKILKGEPPVKIDPRTGEEFTDWKFIISKDENDTRDKILEFVSEKIPQHYGVNAAKDIQVISPGKKSEVGTFKLNELLRQRLNGRGSPRFRGFRMGDKVINRKNIPALEICNGDVGFIIEIGDYGMTVDFGPGAGRGGEGVVKLEGDHADNIHLNYAQTVHSTQGSEMPIAVIPLHRCHWKQLSRNLLYTGQTRARKAAVIVGDPDALRRCLVHSETESRTTGLNYWLDKYNQN